MVCDVVVCFLKNMYCIASVFMLQKLKLMGILVHPNLNLLNISEKFVLDGISMKGSCSDPTDD